MRAVHTGDRRFMELRCVCGCGLPQRRAEVGDRSSASGNLVISKLHASYRLLESESEMEILCASIFPVQNRREAGLCKELLCVRHHAHDHPDSWEVGRAGPDVQSEKGAGSS